MLPVVFALHHRIPFSVCSDSTSTFEMVLHVINILLDPYTMPQKREGYIKLFYFVSIKYKSIVINLISILTIINITVI
jgi:hypothetical protein